MAQKPKLNWRYSGQIPVATNAREDILDAIYDWLNDPASMYHNGSVRVPDQGSAWTALREQDGGTTIALRLQPPATATRRHQRVLIYGRDDISVENPTHAPNDTKTNQRIFAAHVKFVDHGDESAYTSFDAASPYTGHTWSSFCGVVGTQTISHVSILEGTEAISIWFRVSTGPMMAFVAGDIADGHGVLPAESDDGIYGIATSGWANALNSADVHRLASFLHRSAIGNGDHKFRGYVPGGASDVAGHQANGTVNNPQVGVFSRGSAHFRLPMFHHGPIGLKGRMREIFIVERGLSGTVLQKGPIPLAYLMGGSTDAVHDLFAFEH